MTQMIDWVSLVFNACWIVGLALLLAQFSYRRWQKSAGYPVTNDLQRALVTAIGYGLIGLGLIGTADAWWERVLWLALIAAIIFLTIKGDAPPDRTPNP